MQDEIFQRSELLLGTKAMNALSQKKVIIFGIGGVGSWCAESLIRTGLKHLTIVDSDNVEESNINRQLHATTETLGKAKIEILKQRLLSINPQVEVTGLKQRYNEESSPSFHLDSYDYIIDAIDSLDSKIHLIQTATRTNAVFFSSMGAALKMDPSRIKVAEFWKVEGCPLGAALRRKFRKEGMPSRKFQCVYSNELLSNQKESKANGTVVHVTAVFGFTLAGLVIRDIASGTSLVIQPTI